MNNQYGKRIFTVKEVDDAINKVVSRQGEDYVYPKWDRGCVYRDIDNCPSCIVGHVVYELEPELLLELCEGNTMDSQSIIIRERFMDESLYALTEAQSSQDGGQPWGHALVAYNQVRFGVDEEYEELD